MQQILLAEHRRDARAQLRHALPRQCRRVHLPGAIRQVVGLVDEQARAALAVKVALQAHTGIEHVVVVADHHVGQLRQIQRQLEGADFKLPRQFGDGLRVQHLHLHGPPQRLPAALEVAVAVAAQHAVRLALKADLLLCGQRHRSNAQTIATHQLQRILRRPAARGARGEIEHAGHLPRAQRLQRAVERRRRLADAGGGLDQRTPARAQRMLHAVRHLPLALAELRKWKAQALERRLGGLLPALLGLQLPRVGQRVGHEAPRKLLPIQLPLEAALTAVHAHVDQLHLRRSTAVPRAEQMRVDLRLGPVGGIVLAEDLVGVDPRGLDLGDVRAVPLQPCRVRAALHPQCNATHLHVQRHGKLRDPALVQHPLHGDVALAALPHARGHAACGGDAARGAGEFRQRPHAHHMDLLQRSDLFSLDSFPSR